MTALNVEVSRLVNSGRMTERIQRADLGYIARLFVKDENQGFWTAHHWGTEPFQPRGEAPGIFTSPVVIEGNWLVLCPCGGAQLATPECPRFFCVDCINAASGHQWVAVTWPSPEMVRGIEAALVVRPREHRNWMPDESVGWLIAENHEHGLVDWEAGLVAGWTGRDLLYSDVTLAPTRRLALPVSS